MFQNYENSNQFGYEALAESAVSCILYLAETAADLTGLKDFPRYLTLLFEVDALFLNDDRHLNNIAVLEQDGRFDYCPIFDNGAALLSNTQLRIHRFSRSEYDYNTFIGFHFR